MEKANYAEIIHVDFGPTALNMDAGSISLGIRPSMRYP